MRKNPLNWPEAVQRVEKLEKENAWLRERNERQAEKAEMVEMKLEGALEQEKRLREALQKIAELPCDPVTGRVVGEIMRIIAQEALKGGGE